MVNKPLIRPYSSSGKAEPKLIDFSHAALAAEGEERFSGRAWSISEFL